MLEMTAVLTYISFGILEVGADNVVTINWYLLAYYVLGIMVIINVFNFLWDSGKRIAAAISAALLIMVFIFYSYRWFPSSSPTSSSSTCSGTPSAAPSCGPWPPIVNMCPDYMVLWKDTVSNINYCYDVNNTYLIKSYSGAPAPSTSGLTNGLTINGVPGQSAYKLSDLKTNLTSSTSSIRRDDKGKYLRWEGVLDGLSLNAENFPY
jgi:hypothetical protein